MCGAVFRRDFKWGAKPADKTAGGRAPLLGWPRVQVLEESSDSDATAPPQWRILKVLLLSIFSSITLY